MRQACMDGIRRAARLSWVARLAISLAVLVFIGYPTAHAVEDSGATTVPVSAAADLVTATTSTGPQPGNDDTAIAHRFERADLVAKVRITTIHRIIDNALSEPGMSAILGHVYSARVQTVYKGEAGKLLAFSVRFDACQEKLKKGDQYLVFAQADTEGRLQVNSCDGILSGADAASLLVYFDAEQAKTVREKL